MLIKIDCEIYWKYQK